MEPVILDLEKFNYDETNLIGNQLVVALFIEASRKFNGHEFKTSVQEELIKLKQSVKSEDEYMTALSYEILYNIMIESFLRKHLYESNKAKAKYNENDVNKYIAKLEEEWRENIKECGEQASEIIKSAEEKLDTRELAILGLENDYTELSLNVHYLAEVLRILGRNEQYREKMYESDVNFINWNFGSYLNIFTRAYLGRYNF